MIPLAVAFAATSGVLVAINRQLNGRLALSTTPLVASFVNHVVGFALLTLAGLATGSLLPATAASTPAYAYLGGPLGVVFVAASSWVVPRLGAVRTTLLLLSGQMLSGVLLDIVSGTPGNAWARLLGVALILAGVLLTPRRR